MERDLEELLRSMGFELVQLERGGGRRRPVLRLRVDHLPSWESADDGCGANTGSTDVTVSECARVSHAVREFLERRGEAEDSVLEVSSPGVERPLTKPRDFERFAGRKVRIRGYGTVYGDRKQIEGLLLGLARNEPGARAEIEVDGAKVEVPLAEIARANLVYRIEDDL